ncbi:hypothetical protein AVEN_60776-1 [Araneus ventricosus]|uniref:HTH CENPB-type domain-containing protein n=1 Tax=Araneus ventricosus TaxID=182803 RepID=A0A4Y2SCX0_ARAVE|nr:hypothetical protein AVEN_60776-1 [Araneus ventricosus]
MKVAFEYGDVKGVAASFKNERKSAGKDWLKSLCKRYNLSVRNPEQCSVARAMAFNEAQVTRFYNNMKSCSVFYWGRNSPPVEPRSLQIPVSFLKKTLIQLSLESWQTEREEGATSCHTFEVLPKVALISRQWSRNEILFVTGHDPFSSYFKRFGLAVWDNCACGDVGIPFHYAPTVLLPFPFVSKLLQQFINLPGSEILSQSHMQED